MEPKQITLGYLTSYLVFGGLGLLFVPETFLEIFQSDRDYGDIMPRVAGIFMLALGGLVGMIVYYRDYKYYPFSIATRTTIVLLLMWLYLKDDDPFLIVINIIVLIGLLPSWFVYLREKRQE